MFCARWLFIEFFLEMPMIPINVSAACYLYVTGAQLDRGEYPYSNIAATLVKQIATQ